MPQRRKWTKDSVLLAVKKLKSNLKRKPIKRDNNTLYFLTRKFFGSWNTALTKAGFETKIRQKPRIPDKLTPELSYFIGLLATDGHIVFDKMNKGYKIMIFTSYKDERDIIISLIKKIFNYVPSVRIKHSGFKKFSPNYEIYINSKLLAKYLIERFEIPSGAKSHIIRIGKIFFNNNKLIASAFIRGVIDGDGTVSSKSICTRIASGSPKFLEDVKRLLSIIEINSGNIKKEKDRNTWILYISGKENLRKLRDKLYTEADFFYPRKKLIWKGI